MRTGRPRQFDRNLAVQQAMHLFWQNGYESTSLTQLKAAIGQGITAPSFYAAFGSKEALFKETVSCYMNSHGRVTEPLWDKTLSAREAVERTLRQSARMQCEQTHPPGCMVALGVMSACSQENQQVMKVFEDSRNHNRQGLKACITRAIEDGELLSSTDIAGLTALFDSFLLGISTLVRDGVTLDAIEAGITQVMKLWDVNKQTYG
ncbi:TetR/AcrR family transcriptional regulator [Rouxiella sp. T17]|uniref:TetR/AcrR family transcriptional regulator n=1 Tax=Rouxiella sp. T17 TaxID=3085684 RepID=UPI002FC8C38D